MDWKETAMKEEQMLEIMNYVSFSPDFSSKLNKLIEKQAELSFKAGQQAGRKEVVEFANKFLDIAEQGDYSNGVEFYGVDEGRVKARNQLNELREGWQAKLAEWGVLEG